MQNKVQQQVGMKMTFGQTGVNDCPSCKVMGYTTLAHCDQCWWRWAARLIKRSRLAWWQEQKEKGRNMDEIRAYWLKVRAYDYPE